MNQNHLIPLETRKKIFNFVRGLLALWDNGLGLQGAVRRFFRLTDGRKTVTCFFMPPTWCFHWLARVTGQEKWNGGRKRKEETVLSSDTVNQHRPGWLSAADGVRAGKESASRGSIDEEKPDS